MRAASRSAAKGESDRALADFDRAIALEPDNANYYDNRGNVWRDRGRFDRAVEDYDKAIELAPDFAFAFYNRSQAHYLAGRFARGAGRCRQGRRTQRELGQALSLRGLIQEKLGARDAAIADLRRAAALDPNLRQPIEALQRLGVTR